jgi:type VI secretion system protein ImpG
MMPLGKGKTDFNIEIGAPCASIRCVGEPTRPKVSINQGDNAWDLINLLSTNFLGFSSEESNLALASLTKLLNLMSDKKDPAQVKQLDGLIGLEISTITARLPFSGPICFGRGIEIKLSVDENAFEGGSPFLLATILDSFFCQYASTNSFTQLVLISSERGELHRWPIRIGSQNAI